MNYAGWAVGGHTSITLSATERIAYCSSGYFSIGVILPGSHREDTIGVRMLRHIAFVMPFCGYS
jgi:hypothetical protein